MTKLGSPEISMTPRSALDSFVRERASIWLSNFLKIELRSFNLEELFLDCWVLGRVADAADSLLKGVDFSCPKRPQNRSSLEILADFEHFHSLCDTLNIDKNSRFTLGDVEQLNSGPRIACCLWDVANALRLKGHTYAVPEFASPSDYAALRNAAPKDYSRAQIERYEETDANTSPPFQINKPRPVIPPLPLDTSPALAKYRARVAAPSVPKENKKSKNPKEGSAELTSSSKEKDSNTDAPKTEEFDVLTSILSPEKNKPAHTQVMNALLRYDDHFEHNTDDDDDDEDLHTAQNEGNSSSALKNARSSFIIDGTHNNHNHVNNKSTHGNNYRDRYVHKVPPGSNQPWWKIPLIVAGGALWAILVVNNNGNNSAKKTGNTRVDNNNDKEKRHQWRGNNDNNNRSLMPRHVGRW